MTDSDPAPSLDPSATPTAARHLTFANVASGGALVLSLIALLVAACGQHGDHHRFHHPGWESGPMGQHGGLPYEQEGRGSMWGPTPRPSEAEPGDPTVDTGGAQPGN